MSDFEQAFSAWTMIFAGAGLVSYGLGFLVMVALEKWRIIDQPNERSSHVRPTLRGGGAGIMLVIWLGCVILLRKGETQTIWVILASSVVLSVVSFLDDRRPLSWRLRLAVQIAATLIALAALYGQSPHKSAILAVFPVLLLALVGYANAFNFMDGINGLAAVQATLTGFGTALVAVTAGIPQEHPAIVMSLLMAGAAAGFLPHNFPRASMFMGDVGSVPLGFLLALCAIWIAVEHGLWLLIPFGLLHANFILDTGITVVLRMLRGEPVHQAHCEHFYQRLVRAGKSHRFVTGWEGFLQALVLIVVVTAMKMRWIMTMRFVAIGIVCAIWIGFFSYAEFKFRRRLITGNAS